MMETLKPFSSFDEADREKILAWIRNNYTPQKGINHKHSGYTLKQPVTSQTGVYIRTEQFHDAMLECGFTAKQKSYRDGEDYFYNVSERSRGLHPGSGRKA